MSVSIQPARLRWPFEVAQVWTAFWLLVAIGYAVLVATHIRGYLSDAADPVAAQLSQGALVTAGLRVVVIAAAFWLVLLRRGAGFVVAIVYGAATLLLLALSVTTQPPASADNPVPVIVPLWLQLIGAVSAGAMALGGGLALRTRR